MQQATPTRKNRDCRIDDPGVGLGQPPRGERYHGGWGLGSRNTRGPCPPGRPCARPSSARPPLSSPSMGEPHSAGRTQSNDASSTGGPAESRVVVPRPPGGQAAEGWFQTTSQDAPRGSPKPPYTRGSASPLGKSHGGSQSRGLHLTLLAGHTLQVCPSPCAPASQGPASRTSKGVAGHSRGTFTTCTTCCLNCTKNALQMAFWQGSWLCSPKKTTLRFRVTIGLGTTLGFPDKC